jgi:glycosyltransferase involved in cell wall biosynthesis
MKVTIGILAHNESERIRKTIRSLFQQSLISPGREDVKSVEIVCLPNGVKDDTAAIAAEELSASESKVRNPRISVRIHEIERGDRANALNVLYHDASAPDTDYIIQMDADIEIEGQDALSNMIDALRETPRAKVASVAVAKDTAFKERKTVLDRISLAASGHVQAGRESTSGCLSCLRTEVARLIWLPIGMMGTDHFLNHALLSNGFTTRDFCQPFVMAPGARAIFETYKDLRSILHHQRRRVIASTMNWTLFEHLYEVGKAGDTGPYIRQKNDVDPHWIAGFMQDLSKRSGWWVVSPKAIQNRFLWVRNRRGLAKIPVIPLALMATAVDMFSALRANLAMRSESRWLTKYW